MTPSYQFTEDWFSNNAPVWKQLLQQTVPSSFLEIGSYEGRATCFLIHEIASQRPMEIHCIDTWEGGVENDPTIMGDVERRFDHNVAEAIASAAHPVAFRKHKALSSLALAELLAGGRRGSFDFVYVDGSHQAPDVLLDAVLGFQLAKVGGVIVFDDYLWPLERSGAQNHYNMPKPVVDAFVNIYQRKLDVYKAPLYQLYVQKIGM